MTDPYYIAAASARAHRDEKFSQKLQQQQIALHQQQLDLARYTADRQDMYQVAMWRQTADGAAYLVWCDRIIDTLSRLRIMNETWMNGWIWATATALGKDITPPRHVLTNHPVPRFVGLSGVGLWIVGGATGRPAIAIIGILLAITGLILACVRSFRTRAATAARTKVFGFDPFDRRYIPYWSVPDSDFNNISHTQSIEWYLADGGRSFPHPSALPQIELPHVGPPHLPELMNDTCQQLREIAGQS